MRVNQQHSLSGWGARGLLYAGKHLKNRAGQSRKHCLQGLPNAVEKTRRANKHLPSIHKAGWQQKAWSFTCLPSAERQPVWHEAWKNALPSCTGWQWRNKTEDHARSDGELDPVLGTGSGCWCPGGVNTCGVGSLLGPRAAPGHAELAQLLLPAASRVAKLRPCLQGNSWQWKAFDWQLWSPTFSLSP